MPPTPLWGGYLALATTALVQLLCAMTLNALLWQMLLVAVALDIGLIHREAFRFFLSFWAISLFKKPELAER